MEYLNIWDKLSLLFDLINNNYFFIGFLTISIVVCAINRLRLITNKKAFLIIMLAFVILFSIILFYSGEVLFITFDNISNLIFRNIYFPSIYVYLAIILITDSILLISLLSKNISKLYKGINVVVSFIINFILLILLNTIGKDNIDILSTTSLYTNSYVVSLIELTTGVFIVWLVSLLLIAVINSILSSIDNKKMDNEPIMAIDKVLNTIELEVSEPASEMEAKTSNLEIYPLNNLTSQVIAQVSIDKKSDVDIPKVISMPSQDLVKEEATIKELVFNDFVKKDNELLNNLKKEQHGIETLMNLKPIKPVTVSNEVVTKEKSITISDILPNFEIKVEEPLVEEVSFKSMSKYTKEDYQLFNKVLKVVKEFNNNNQYITKDDALNINLLNKFSIKEYNLYKKMLEEVNG